MTAKDQRDADRPSAGLDWSEHEDDIASAISDSMDMDWSSHDAARAVVEFLNGLTVRAPLSQEQIGQIIYEANPLHDQETDADGRPTGPGYAIPWAKIHEYDRGIYDDVIKTAASILALAPTDRVAELEGALIKNEAALRWIYENGFTSFASCPIAVRDAFDDAFEPIRDQRALPSEERGSGE